MPPDDDAALRPLLDEHDVIVRIDASGRIVHFIAGGAYGGKRAAEVVGRCIEELVPAAEAAIAREAMARAAATNEPQRIEHSWASAGATRALRARVVPIGGGAVL